MTLKSAFKKIYAERLSTYGYVYCSKLDRFVKVVNNEFLHFIGLTSKGYIAFENGYKAFSITGMIVSIYYPYVEKSELNAISTHLDAYSPAKETIYGFKYNEGCMEEALLKSYTYVEQDMLPVMERVIDYDTYIKYQIRMKNEMLSFANKFWLDSLVLIVNNNHDDFMWLVEENFARASEESKSQLLYDGMRDVIVDFITKPRDEVFEDLDLLSAALEEAKLRKMQNIEKLKSYKLL